jgi:DNA modification methylase
LDTRHVFYIGDAIDVLKRLPSESVHCVVTSPPYYGLRDYKVPGQIGLERTPEEYVERLVGVFREVRRVLRPDGTLWINLGDTHAANRSYQVRDNKHVDVGNTMPMRVPSGLKPKDLIGIPWMVAFALRADGWWLRDDIIWAKGISGEIRAGNPMPEPIRDRPVSAHEYVFLFSKSEEYYYDDDAVGESPLTGDTRPPLRRLKIPSGWDTSKGSHGSIHRLGRSVGTFYAETSRSRLPRLRDVWLIFPEPFPGPHFATFPTRLAALCILAGTSEFGCCSACGAPYERVVERQKARVERRRSKVGDSGSVRRRDLPERPGGFVGASSVTVGWRSTCDCNAEVMACTILDPFGGSGTVSLVAKRFGRNSIYVDLNPDYARMAVDRCGPWHQPRLDGEDAYEVIDARMGEEAVP